MGIPIVRRGPRPGWRLEACDTPWHILAKREDAAPFTVANQPVVGVTWFEASAYATAQGRVFFEQTSVSGSRGGRSGVRIPGARRSGKGTPTRGKRGLRGRAALECSLVTEPQRASAISRGTSPNGAGTSPW